MSALEHALACTARGWRVFPLVPHSKAPVVPKREGGRGYRDATCDGAQLRAWWRRWPDAGIGIATGAHSGLVVLDIDPRHDGDESLEQLEARFGTLPETPVSLTGGGGTHYLFTPGGALPCRTALGGFAGVDLKADGGYIVAPPSIHPSGREYAWNVHLHPDDLPLASCPTWLVELANARPEVERAAYTAREVTPELEQKLASLIGLSRKVCERFYRSTVGLADKSPSGVDYSLACMLAFRGFDGAAIEHAVRASREAAGLHAKGSTYYASTIGKAISAAQLVTVAA